MPISDQRYCRAKKPPAIVQRAAPVVHTAPITAKTAPAPMALATSPVTTVPMVRQGGPAQAAPAGRDQVMGLCPEGQHFRG